MPEIAEQLSERPVDQKRPPGNPAWTKGTSGNLRGRESAASRRERIADRIETWTAPFGGLAAFNAAEMTLLHQAAELSLRRWRTADDQLRIARTISKLLAQVGIVNARGTRRAEPPDPFLLTLDRPEVAPAGNQRTTGHATGTGTPSSGDRG
jgi:hypothetical protein